MRQKSTLNSSTQTGRSRHRIENVRLAPYGAAPQLDDGSAQRHPMLRVLWKPDVTGGLLRALDFTKYPDAFLAEAHSEFNDEGIIKLGASLNLLSRKSPAPRILELGNDVPEITQGALSFLLALTPFKRLLSYTTGSISEDGNLIGAVVTPSVNQSAFEKSSLVPVESRLSNAGASIVMCYNLEDDQVDKFVHKTPIVIVDH